MEILITSIVWFFIGYLIRGSKDPVQEAREFVKKATKKVETPETLIVKVPTPDEIREDRKKRFYEQFRK